MYSLKDAWVKMQGSIPYKNWDGKMHCVWTDTPMTFRANTVGGFFSAYTFTLVREGWLTIVYNGKELTLNPDDLYVYSPGMPVTILSASENYKGICLLVDEYQTLGTVTHYVYAAGFKNPVQASAFRVYHSIVDSISFSISSFLPRRAAKAARRALKTKPEPRVKKDSGYA